MKTDLPSFRYTEGLSVLYGTNTFIMDSKLLVLRSHVVPASMFENLRSLELVWQDADSLEVHNAALTAFHQTKFARPLFPFLAHLRICCPFLFFIWDVNHAPRDFTMNRQRRRRMLQLYLVPKFDAILERLCPAKTDVTISMATWNVYKIIDRMLLKTQGVEESRPQLAEIGGLKI